MITNLNETEKELIQDIQHSFVSGLFLDTFHKENSKDHHLDRH